jgi:hypothetical protein
MPLNFNLLMPSCAVVSALFTGQLNKGAHAIILVSARADSTVGPGGWRGQVEVFSENSRDVVEVQVRSGQQAAAPSRLVANPPILDLGVAEVGSSKTGTLRLANLSLDLVQWAARVEPSFFSLPQSSALLNPAQAVTLQVCFRPGAIGPCTAVLEFSSHPLKVA